MTVVHNNEWKGIYRTQQIQHCLDDTNGVGDF
jgi:hypothetical protein